MKISLRTILMMLVAELLLAHTLCAQITLDSTSYPASLIGTDSLKVTTAASAFPSLTSAIGGMWDLSTVADSVPLFYKYRVAAPPYSFADSNLLSFSGFNYQGSLLANNTASGLVQYKNFIPRVAYNIFSITSGPTDSFIIPAQTDLYSSPRKKIAFPATYGSAWASAYQSDFNFVLTYLLGGDTLAPGIVRTYTTEQDSVTGWGKMRIRDASGGASPFLNVLQVQTRITTIDSFFLKGVPFSSTMLTFFSVTQGQKDTIYQQNYYRPQEVTPLAQVEFRDAGYTQPFRATTHVQRLQNVGVADVARVSKAIVYPNPVQGRTLHICLPDDGNKYTYELTAITGHKVLCGQLLRSGAMAIIELPMALSPGIYYLQLTDETGQTTLVPIDKE